MIDAHCHIDAYTDPYETALLVERSRVLTIAVTNSPAAFDRAYPHVRNLRYIRLAVGLHPLMTHENLGQREQFVRCLERTSYVGEVGLDFSREGLETKAQQLETFRFVLQQVSRHPKFVSVHSRRAESAVLDLADEFGVRPLVFHWFSGSVAQLDRLISSGHYCSVNPAMVRSVKGQALMQHMPLDRVLTETDGPFISMGDKPALPADVSTVEAFLGKTWGWNLTNVRVQLKANLCNAIPDGD